MENTIPTIATILANDTAAAEIGMVKVYSGSFEDFHLTSFAWPGPNCLFRFSKNFMRRTSYTTPVVMTPISFSSVYTWKIKIPLLSSSAQCLVQKGIWKK